MGVLVCGGRDYHNQVRVFDTLNTIHKDNPITYIIHGGAKGADKLGGSWAFRRGDVNVHVYTAQWDKYGKRAGYLRNREMLVKGKPDLVVAFPGGKGTAMMIRLAKEAGVSVLQVLPEDQVDYERTGP